MKLKLEQWRLNNGLSQAEVANAAGVNPSSIYKWEKGIMMPRMYNLNRLAKHYNIPLSTLIELDDQTPRADYAVKTPETTYLIETHTQKKSDAFSKILQALPSLSDNDLKSIWAIIERLKGE